MMVKNSWGIWTFVCFLPMFSSCSSTHIKKTDHSQSVVHQINLLAVEYFSPTYDPAEHDDFTRKIEKVDCQTPASFYRSIYSSINLPELLQCINSIRSGKAEYWFTFKAQPRLEIDMEAEHQPACLKQMLPILPLPREIYFLGRVTEEEPLDCYSASFNTRPHRVFASEILTKKLKMIFRFPVSRELKSERDLLIWLMVTTFDLLNQGPEGQDKRIHADRVPSLLCKQCFANDRLFEEKKSEKIPASLWNQ